MDHIGGWLLVYLIGSVPLLAFYSLGLSGWFYDYPWILMVTIFVGLSVPLALLILKAPSAPFLNIILLWVGAGLITFRILHAALQMDLEELKTEGLILAMIIVVAIVWAIIWTRYFTVSERIAKSYSYTTDPRNIKTMSDSNNRHQSLRASSKGENLERRRVAQQVIGSSCILSRENWGYCKQGRDHGGGMARCHCVRRELDPMRS